MDNNVFAIKDMLKLDYHASINVLLMVILIKAVHVFVSVDTQEIILANVLQSHVDQIRFLILLKVNVSAEVELYFQETNVYQDVQTMIMQLFIKEPAFVYKDMMFLMEFA